MRMEGRDLKNYFDYRWYMQSARISDLLEEWGKCDTGSDRQEELEQSMTDALNTLRILRYANVKFNESGEHGYLKIGLEKAGLGL